MSLKDQIQAELRGDPEVLRALAELRELLSEAYRWLQDCWARDVEDAPVGPRDPKATSWCLIGGIERVCLGAHGPTGYDAWEDPEKETLREDLIWVLCETCSRLFPEEWDEGTSVDLIEWNDAPHRRHEDVLKLIDGLLEEFQGQA